MVGVGRTPPVPVTLVVGKGLEGVEVWESADPAVPVGVAPPLLVPPLAPPAPATAAAAVLETLPLLPPSEALGTTLQLAPTLKALVSEGVRVGLGEENTEGVDAGDSEVRELSVIVALVMESMDTVCVEEGGADTTED